MSVNFFHDIDLYGREARAGIALEYFNADAVKNALELFLTSKRGDFIRNPSAGGIIDFNAFKVMNNANIQKLEFTLKNAINNYFQPAIEIQSIEPIPDYDNHILQINITYLDLTTLIINQVSLYTDTSYQYQKFEFVTVEYTEDNLLKFCMLEKPAMMDKKLLYNTDDGIWYYGKFKFVNFSQSDIRFSEILAVCNQ